MEMRGHVGLDGEFLSASAQTSVEGARTGLSRFLAIRLLKTGESLSRDVRSEKAKFGRMKTLKVDFSNRKSDRLYL